MNLSGIVNRIRPIVVSILLPVLPLRSRILALTWGLFVGMNPCSDTNSLGQHEDTQLAFGFSTRHWNGRNTASFAKSRALAVITVIPKRPALIAISESFVKRPFPICS